MCLSYIIMLTGHLIKLPSYSCNGLDISKAFDRVLHEGLLYKLKSYGISGPLLILIKSFLANRFQSSTQW